MQRRAFLLKAMDFFLEERALLKYGSFWLALFVCRLVFLDSPRRSMEDSLIRHLLLLMR